MRIKLGRSRRSGRAFGRVDAAGFCFSIWGCSIVTRRIGRSRLVLIGIVALALVAASCGSDDDGGASDTTAAGGGTATTVAGKACSGDPIKIGQIVALTGQQTFPDLAAGARAAVEAENKECRLDRPLELVQRDGKNDPNAVAECGRKMVSEGIVALVTSVDPAIDSALSIIYAAKIPHVANSASST